jgi:hypothetical protein
MSSPGCLVVLKGKANTSLSPLTSRTSCCRTSCRIRRSWSRCPHRSHRSRHQSQHRRKTAGANTVVQRQLVRYYCLMKTCVPAPDPSLPNTQRAANISGILWGTTELIMTQMSLVHESVTVVDTIEPTTHRHRYWGHDTYNSSAK